MQRVMALDVGDSRIGVAVSDQLCMFAQPLKTIDRTKDAQTLREIAELAAEQNVKTIVIGLPRELSGDEGDQAGKVRQFAEKLERVLAKRSPAPPPIVYFDERFTSIQAERMMAGSKLKDRDRHAAVDRISASLILESYLSSAPREGSAGTKGSEESGE